AAYLATSLLQKDGVVADEVISTLRRGTDYFLEEEDEERLKTYLRQFGPQYQSTAAAAAPTVAPTAAAAPDAEVEAEEGEEVGDRDGGEGMEVVGDEEMDGSNAWDGPAIRCDACNKWRHLASCVDSEALPDEWRCSMNTWDLDKANCAAPQDDTLDYSAEDRQNFNEGSFPTGENFDLFCGNSRPRAYYEVQVVGTDKSMVLFRFLFPNERKFDVTIAMGSKHIKPHHLFTKPNPPSTTTNSITTTSTGVGVGVGGRLILVPMLLLLPCSQPVCMAPTWGVWLGA
ncbi:hypothetical protein B484DRAFT_390457, partial [Ochromonadaceae sp. CCMP2298]